MLHRHQYVAGMPAFACTAAALTRVHGVKQCRRHFRPWNRCCAQRPSEISGRPSEENDLRSGGAHLHNPTGHGRCQSSQSESPTKTLSQAEAATAPTSPAVSARPSRTRVRLLDTRVVVRAALESALSAEKALLTRRADLRPILAQVQADRRALKKVHAEETDGAREVALRLSQLAEDLAKTIRELYEAEAEHQSRSRQKQVDLSIEPDRQLSRASTPAGISKSTRDACNEVSMARQDASAELQSGAIRGADNQSVNTTEHDSSPGALSPNPFSGSVTKVKDNLIESGSFLIRRASNVGAGLEEAVSSFVRDDGSLDLEKLRNNIRGGLDRVGDTWQRLNGQDPAMSQEKPESVTVSNAYITDAMAIGPVRDVAKIAELRSQIDVLEKQLDEASKSRESLLRREDQLGKLIRAREIRAMDDTVSAIRRTLAVRVLQLEMETIFTSLSEEVERSSFEVMEKRIMIAEFGDMDDRLMVLVDFVDQDAPVLIDDEDVGVLACDIQDLKMRLGLDLEVYSSRPDITQVRQIISSSIVKARAGADFYGRGLRLFWGDCRYALLLLRRVFTGYTLSPREVRTLRRTGRDILALVPFTVILVLPLSPVGHVLVFGFLQRYWPDFFPSTFSESRQTLMKRHETYARSIHEESSLNGNGEVAANSNNNSPPQQPVAGLLWRFPFFMSMAKFGQRGRPMVTPVPSVGLNEGNSEGEQVAPQMNNITKRDQDNFREGRGGQRALVGLDELVEEAKSGRFVRRGRAAVALDDLHLAD